MLWALGEGGLSLFSVSYLSIARERHKDTSSNLQSGLWCAVGLVRVCVYGVCVCLFVLEVDSP